MSLILNRRCQSVRNWFLAHATLAGVLGIAILISASGRTTPATAQEWTRFRGPNGSGVSDATTVPVEFSKSEINWRAELPGAGHSAAVIWGDQVFVTSASSDGSARYLLCIDADTGKEQWREEFAFAKQRTHANNTNASSTPTVDAEHVYVLWESPQGSPLVAMNHDGTKAWEYDLGVYKNGQGNAASLITYQDLVIISNDHGPGSALVAVRCDSGELAWKIPRKGERACYTTPCVYQPEGKPAEIIFTHCYEGIVGVDPQTGEQNWMIDVFGRSDQRAIGSPVIADDLVIGASDAAGGERYVVAVRPEGPASDMHASEVYRVTELAPHCPTPIVYDGMLFLWADNGIASCYDAATGEKIWQARIGGDFFGSPICVDGKLYCVSESGDVVVIAAADTFKLLARNSLGEPSHSTPAVSGGVLYVRTMSSLFSIGGPK